MAAFMLKWPSKLFELYIKSSLHVALAVASLAYVTVHELGIKPDPLLFGFIFSSTVVSYNLTKYSHLVAADSAGVRPLLKWIAFITACFFLVIAASLFYLPLDVIIAASLLGAITIAYAIPISEGRRNLRNIYGIKIALIAIVWSGVTVWLPAINNGLEYLAINGLVVEFFQRILFVVVLVLPFDIRDYRNDDSGLGTLPQIIGIKNSKLLGLIFLIACIHLEWILTPNLSAPFIIFIVIAGITALMVRRSMIIQSPYFASFWVEGIPLVWAALLYVSYFF